MSKYGCLFEAGGMMTVSIDHSLPPGHGGDVGPDLSINFLGHHAEDAEVPHWNIHICIQCNLDLLIF